MRLLEQIGYTNVRHYHGGIADWKEAGLPVESASAAAGASRSAPGALRSAAQSAAGQSSPVSARRGGAVGHPTLSRSRQWGSALLDLIESLSPGQIFVVWLGMVLVCGCLYWLTGFSGRPGLVDGGTPIAATLSGLMSAIYFSFVTTTSVGYGDVLPIGPMRVLSIFEAVTGLLIFGALVAKFVSRRQDELVRDIYNVTFEGRLDRVQTNLHLVLSELQSIAMMCDDGMSQPQRVAVRLESAVLVFGGELRAIHALLYNPQRAPEEAVLEAILVALASALRTLSDVLTCLPPALERPQALQSALRMICALADDICAECVPQVYAPTLTEWMDRVQQTARRIF
ncbi:MAG TPA: ion channel [Candidatus Binataceae bacterium]|nr:ion channel [Candidatus Binataceae bacterium]